MSIENFEQLKANLEESKRKEKAYFKQIVAANNVLRKMPRTGRFIVVLVVKGSKLL